VIVHGQITGLCAVTDRYYIVRAYTCISHSSIDDLQKNVDIIGLNMKKTFRVNASANATRAAGLNQSDTLCTIEMPIHITNVILFCLGWVRQYIS
jgi:hypothetical protein